MKIKKAVIPAAGWGTRFLPITKGIPKEMIPIIDKPVLSYIVEEAHQSGIEEIVFIVSEHKECIKTYFGENKALEEFLTHKNNDKGLAMIKQTGFGMKFHYVIQKEQLGLGHAILQAKELIGNEPFAILLGDDVYYSDIKPALKQIIDLFGQKNSSVLGTMEVPMDQTSKYGICKPKHIDDEGVMELEGVVEKPKINAPSRYAISGRYVLTPTIFKYLETQNQGAQGEIQLTDAILRMMSEEKVYAYNMIGKRYDTGSKIGYLEAIIDYTLRNEELKESFRNLLREKL